METSKADLEISPMMLAMEVEAMGRDSAQMLGVCTGNISKFVCRMSTACRGGLPT